MLIPIWYSSKKASRLHPWGFCMAVLHCLQQISLSLKKLKKAFNLWYFKMGEVSAISEWEHVCATFTDLQYFLLPSGCFVTALTKPSHYSEDVIWLVYAEYPSVLPGKSKRCQVPLFLHFEGLQPEILWPTVLQNLGVVYFIFIRKHLDIRGERGVLKQQTSLLPWVFLSN